MIRSIAGSIARPLAVAITGASGGAAPAPVDAYAANGFSPAFVVDETVDSAPYYRSGGLDVGYSDIYTTDTTAGGLCTQNDSSGNLVWGPHNLFVNSESPATQNITVVVGAQYTVEMEGTGSIALTGAGTGTASAGSPATITASTTTLTCTVSGSPTRGWAYRSDLGGMADVISDQRTSGAPANYLATGGSAKYALRRRHYRYNGTSYVPTLLHEPVGATNTHDYSRDFTAGSWSGGTPTANAVGIDGVSNSAHTITDSNSSGFRLMSHTARTAPADTSDWVATYHLKKTTSATTFPGVTLIFAGVDAYSATVNTNTGVVTARTTQVPDEIYVSDEGGYWRVSIVGANTNSRTTVAQWTYPAVESGTVTGTWSSSVTGSCVIDQYDLVNASVPSSPIITTGASVTRSADTCKVKAAALPYDSTNMSLALAGRYSRPSTSAVYRLYSWYLDANNEIAQQFQNNASAGPYPLVEDGGTVSFVTFNTSFGAGYLLPIKAALRAVGNGDLQAAEDGVSSTVGSVSTPLPDLSAANLTISAAGAGGQEMNTEVDTLILWSDDIAEAGIESGSASVEIQGVPTISGTEAVGSTLTASAATVVGGPSPSTTWQWQRSANGTSGWADISGATSSTYTLVSADENQYVRAVQTTSATAGGDTYTDSANSVASGQIANLPLDTVTSAVLAFSTARKLRTAYTGDAIRVRRSSDNAEQDIGFDGSGNLDESALTTFVGANDGFITKIYGQVGLVDLAQSTAANQPQIVSSGSVIKQGGKPAADFGGLGNPATGVGNLRYLDADAASTLSQPNTVFAVHQFLSAASTQVLFDCGSGDRNSIAADATQYLMFSGSIANSGIAPDTDAHVCTSLFNGASSQVWVDNAGSGAINPGSDGLGTFRVGANLTPGFSLSGTLPEIIVCDADESGATRSALEANQASFYGITLA